MPTVTSASPACRGRNDPCRADPKCRAASPVARSLWNPAHSKSGYLVTAGDNKKFADKLKDAAKLSLDEYDVMSRYAYQYGCKKYATSGAVGRFVEMLEA